MAEVGTFPLNPTQHCCYHVWCGNSQQRSSSYSGEYQPEGNDIITATAFMIKRYFASTEFSWYVVDDDDDDANEDVPRCAVCVP